MASGAGLLHNPGVRQLLVVFALVVGNKQLATSIIENYPPGPDHETLFSPRCLSQRTVESTRYQGNPSSEHSQRR